ncbi:MAG: glycosyltransferase family 87 protein, partial [Chloroflexota bacterium]
MKNYLRIMLAAWLSVTLLIILSLLVIYLRNGQTGLELFIQQWPLSSLPIALASTALTWLGLGALAYLVFIEKINAKNALTFAGLFLVLFVYLNVLRERFRYGDYHYYLEAANALIAKQPLPDTYIYLPLWATLVQFVAPLGDEGVLLVLWLLNIGFLIGFYFLLLGILERYGFSTHLSAILTTLFLLVNTPLHRSLGYVQVNLLVMVLVIGSMLLFPKKTFISALLLALAVHLKTSPAVLVLAFLLERNWRWLFWFGVSFVLIGLFPIAINGVSPYFDFLTNIKILAQNTNTNFHDTSFDSFLRFAAPFFHINPFGIKILIYLSKLLLGIGTLFVMARNIRSRTFIREQGSGAIMLNAIPSLFILMTLASPIVWDHHGIFVTIPFLLILKRLHSPAEWAWFSFAYFLEFILPSFDFFPW